MSKAIIIYYMKNAFILFIASFIGVFVVEKNNKLDVGNNSLGKSKTTNRKKFFLRIIFKKSFWTFRFQKKFWKPIFQKKFFANVFSIFISLLFLLSVFKYYRYL